MKENAELQVLQTMPQILFHLRNTKKWCYFIPFSSVSVPYNGKVDLSFVMNFEKCWALQRAATYSNIVTAHPCTLKTCKLADGAFLLVPGH